MIKCFVIDDEPLAREGLAKYINEIDYLQLIGMAEDPVQALNVVDEQIDLVFVDIQMPKMTGIEFIQTIKPQPMVVITTAYPSFALQGYELNVLDYLVKPITFSRFIQAAQKARQLHELQSSNNLRSSNNEYIFVKVDSKFEKICFAEIIYVEAMQNYVRIKTEDSEYMTLLSMKNMLSQLPDQEFRQVHKSYIVNLDKVKSIEANLLVVKNNKIPMSRRLKAEIIELITKGNILSK